jgi:hypothetical protein
LLLHSPCRLFIWILFTAAVASAGLQAWPDCGLILGVVVINVGIGLFQEGKAEKVCGKAKGGQKAGTMSSVYCIRGGTVWEGKALKLFSLRADPDRCALIAAWLPPQGQLRHDALTALVAVAGLDHLLLADMARRISDNAAVRSLPLLRLCTHAGRPRAIVHSIPS